MQRLSDAPVERFPVIRSRWACGRVGLHSVHDEYRMVRRLGFFNPRRDEVWLLDVDRIDGRLVDWTDHELIGYPKD